MKQYETHITVPPKSDYGALQAFCGNNGYKLIDIRLNKGSHKRQLMVTYQFTTGKDLTAMYDFVEAVLKVKKAGFSITRKKLESNDLIGKSSYFEAHWKLTFDDQKTRVKEQNFLGKRDDIHVSFNGKEHKNNILYLTVRDTDMDEFHTKCEQVDDFLRTRYTKIKFHNERVLIDSKPDLDKGWAN